jgi:hypothetical protein
MDDRNGVHVAERKGLTVTGTLGVLDLAAERRLLDLPRQFANWTDLVSATRSAIENAAGKASTLAIRLIDLFAPGACKPVRAIPLATDA